VLAGLATSRVGSATTRPFAASPAAAPTTWPASDPGCAQAFVDWLNAMDPGQWRWAIWDRELIEKVAIEHGIPGRTRRYEDLRINRFDLALWTSPELAAELSVWPGKTGTGRSFHKRSGRWIAPPRTMTI
jgi:hypothetical protein